MIIIYLSIVPVVFLLVELLVQLHHRQRPTYRDHLALLGWSLVWPILLIYLAWEVLHD